MKIKVKLGGRLKEYRPNSADGIEELTTSPFITVAEVLKRLRISEDTDELLIVINGENVPPSERAGFFIEEDSMVNIMPPLKGG